jgi:4-amino-4-deoxy-L-arabinose transferase-like glycosyltransferase
MKDRPAAEANSISAALKSCFALPNQAWWRLFLIILCWKGTALFVMGVSYEMDSATYLQYALPYHHPPLYAWFLQALEKAMPAVHLIALAQTTIFSLAAALALCHFFRDPLTRYAMALLLAIEPTSTFFCTNLMSEALFSALLLLWLVFLSEYLRQENRWAQWWMLGLLGMVTAALYATRLAAIFLLPFFVLALFAWSRNLRRLLLHSLALVLFIELLLVPVKLTYLQHYSSYSFAMFSGTNLWNSASVLFPESARRERPETEFERFMSKRNLELLTTESALVGGPLDHPGCGYRAFTEGRRFSWEQSKAFEKSLARTGVALILENPTGYWRLFVWPNLKKPITKNEEVRILPWVADLMRERFGYNQSENVKYNRAWWQAYAGLAALLSLFCAMGRFRVGMVGLIVALVWFYWLAHGLGTAISLRYLLVLAPPLLIAAGLQAQRLWQATRMRPTAAGRGDGR